eukprot:TRINITY_DN33918_c0_g1_i2.p1 TRINITY_DN33918_c0_g1~~TRINITY_DN33918_c0_g1_i2.p1  ORF type:complete len:570 (+),score=150.86 TRINITY_DN33918_c0_g1_i2:95-1804(+)
MAAAAVAAAAAARRGILSGTTSSHSSGSGGNFRLSSGATASGVNTVDSGAGLKSMENSQTDGQKLCTSGADSSEDELVVELAEESKTSAPTKAPAAAVARAESSDSEPETSDDEEDDESHQAKVVVLSPKRDKPGPSSTPEDAPTTATGASSDSSAASLLDIMGSAVTSVESSVERPGSATAVSASSSLATSIAAKSCEPQSDRIAGRVLDAAKKKRALALRSAAPASQKSAEATVATGTFSLQGLRKAYQAPAGNSGAKAEENVDDESVDVEHEWDVIAEKTEELAARARENSKTMAAETDVVSKPISYKEVQKLLLNLEVDTSPTEQVEVPDLQAKLLPGVRQFLSFKATPFDFNEVVHHRMLRTMYCKLARAKVCPSIGSHWEVLGFQAGDPRTDLNRSGGLLNVLHMFYFFEHYFDLFKAAYRLAQDFDQNFPLACVSVNITRMVVECLLAGQLSEVCNSENEIFETTCQVHSGGLHHFYYRWRTQKRTIKDSELTFNEVRELMVESPVQLVEGLVRGAEDLRQKTNASRLEFTDLDFGRGAGAEEPVQSDAGAIPARLTKYVED